MIAMLIIVVAMLMLMSFDQAGMEYGTIMKYTYCIDTTGQQTSDIKH